MATKLQHGDSLYQVIEKVNEIIDGTVKPGSGGSGGSSSTSTVTTSMLEAETDRATSAEQYLQDQIDNISNAIGLVDGDEESANNGEDNELQSALIMESIHAATREHNNAQSIADEVARAQAAEQTLQTNINNETTRAQAAEQNLQDQIDAIDVSGLQQAIDNEVTRAQTEEQNLQDQIDDITNNNDDIKLLPLTNVSVAANASYVVKNGWCIVTTNGSYTPSSTGNAKIMCNNLPKAKLRSFTIDTAGDLCWIYTGNTNLVCNITNTSARYITLIYPVADDWVKPTV